MLYNEWFSEKNKISFWSEREWRAIKKIEKFPTDQQWDRKECLRATDKGPYYNQETWLEDYFGLGVYSFSDSDTEGEGYASDDVLGNGSDKSDESNEEQDTSGGCFWAKRKK